MVSPPPDVGTKPAAAAPGRTPTSIAERGEAPAASAVPALDRADIKPLDVAAALQILIAEVREAFELLLIEASSTADAGSVRSGADAVQTANAATVVTSAVPAARALVDMVLQSLPDSLDDGDWSEMLPRVEAALQSGVQRALEVLGAWRDVAPIVTETTTESARLALQVLGDEPQNPLWLRPEWLAMAPQLQRFWRRRRVHRRRLIDPDYHTAAEPDDHTR